MKLFLVIASSFILILGQYTQAENQVAVIVDAGHFIA